MIHFCYFPYYLFAENCKMIVIFQSTPEERENSLDNGIVIGHAYSITDVRIVSQMTSDIMNIQQS